MIQEIEEMVANIPAEARWNIATHTSTATAVALDAAIQHALGPEKRKEILKKIYTGYAPSVKRMIDGFGLLADTAEAAVKAVTLANAVMFGTEIQIDITEENPQKVTSKVIGCAFPLRMKEIGVHMDCLPVCKAYQEATYNAVNSKLKVNIGNKCIIRGDEYCGELVVEMEKENLKESKVVFLHKNNC